MKNLILFLFLFISLHGISQNNPSLDPFGRARVSQPTTLFDSKLLGDSRGLFWDDQETSGGGTSSRFDTSSNTVIISVGDETAGTRVRQTFQRFNYQPGKGQLINMTFTLGTTSSGITKRVGYYDENNGLFLESRNDSIFFVVRSSTSGSPVDNRIYQQNWNISTLDNLDFTKSQIFYFDFESLMVGSVRFGFVIDGRISYAHIQPHANRISDPYFSTPNNPLRYEISNDGTASPDSIKVICTTVISEGGQEDTGIIRGVSTAGTHLDANTADTLYALIGIKLKSDHIDNIVKLKSFSVIAETNDDFEWQIVLNPTVSGTFTYSDKSNSAVQIALGATTNTVNGGTVLDCGFSKQSSNVDKLAETLRYLGAAIDGTVDEIILCVRPLSANADIQGSLTWKETS